MAEVQRDAIFPELVNDIWARDAHGKIEYGKELKTFDGRSTMQDAYEEILDLAVYVKKQMMEQSQLKIEIEQRLKLIQAETKVHCDCTARYPEGCSEDHTAWRYIHELVKELGELYSIKK